MSHTMNIQIELHDRQALQATCQRLGYKMEEGQVSFYSTTEKGILVYLPNWKYPICIKGDGTVAYDNYDGRWGDIKELNKFRAYYGLEKAKIEARKRGYSVYETQDRLGNPVLKVRIGG